MKVHIHDCNRPNIGDDINRWFWQETLGDALQRQPDTLLVGIGTVLNDRLPAAAKYLVVGSGFGYGEGAPPIDENWEFACVRGPKTAAALGLDASVAITDPGVLMPLLRPQDAPRSGIAFMPHISIDSPEYRKIVEQLGWRYVSPSADQDEILADIAGAEKLITSSLHGAIFADAYRTPWLPVSTSPEILPFKWQDWAESMALTFSLEALPALWPDTAIGLKRLLVNYIKRRVIATKLSKLAKSNRFLLSRIDILQARQDALQKRFEALRASICASEIAS